MRVTLAHKIKKMLIDVILNRKTGGIKYHAAGLYNYCIDEYSNGGRKLFADIAASLDGGTETDVKNALCGYVYKSGYDTAICEYVNSVDWLIDENGNRI